MKLTPKEKSVIEQFNTNLAHIRPASQQRPSDAELDKMTDAEILGGDWLVDIEDSTFWNRWDEANANLTLETNKAVAEGRASYWKARNPNAETAKLLVAGFDKALTKAGYQH